MRHRMISRKFKRDTAARKALFMNLSISLIKHESIKTTLIKAKALKRFIEPIINKSKTNTLSSKRFVLSKINNRNIIKKLFEISKRYKNRNGGYTRIIRYKYRKGDGACLAIMSLVS